MTVTAALVSVALFAIAFRLLRVGPAAAEVLVVTRRAGAVMADGTLDDDAKECEVRTASKWLLRRFVGITARAAAVLMVPTTALIGFDWLGLAAIDEVVAFLLRWEVIAAGTVVVLGAGVLHR